MANLQLTSRVTRGAGVIPSGSGWRLEIPAGIRCSYRLAQVDDYARSARARLPHRAPRTLSLRARASSTQLPGTWGFGFWNDPFGLSIGLGGTTMRLPCLPQTAWFFYASPENYLSFQPVHEGQSEVRSPAGSIPPNGFFAGSFASARISTLLFVPAVPLVPILFIPALSSRLRSLASRMIQQSGVALDTDVTAWHEYAIEWRPEVCRFHLDGLIVLETPLSPASPLGLVIWVDNQYAAWKPDGWLGFGTLENPPAWLEIEQLDLKE